MTMTTGIWITSTILDALLTERIGFAGFKAHLSVVIDVTVWWSIGCFLVTSGALRFKEYTMNTTQIAVFAGVTLLLVAIRRPCSTTQ
jgi:hypothetical protein